MDPQAQVFATKGTYQYYTRYYDAQQNERDSPRQHARKHQQIGRGPDEVPPKAPDGLA